jgi:misacylated tRNA(Ala) deacylase
MLMHAKYMDDAYLKVFSSHVVALIDEKSVVLADTIFYPQGGGQPCDLGFLKQGDHIFPVIGVRKLDGMIVHELSLSGLAVGDSVVAHIDWERRYALMRAHTASHAIAAVFHTDFGAKITGNQLATDGIRMDFDVELFDRAMLESSIAKVNSFLAQDLPVSISFMPRDEALRDPAMVKLAGALPPAVAILRIVSIGHVDRQADGGTHVHKTSEIGSVALVKAENKGKSNRRVFVRLVV